MATEDRRRRRQMFLEQDAQRESGEVPTRALLFALQYSVNTNYAICHGFLSINIGDLRGETISC